MHLLRRLRALSGRAAWPAAVFALFTALTVLMTWPQARVFATHARDHQDVYFNMWRLGWFAHALATAPSTLFDGNIFHPEQNVLAFSDAMMVEGLIAAPLLWSGVRPVLVHNLLLLGAIVASAVGLSVLVERLTRNRAASVVAGIIFAFAPYRFEHYMHMELQWTVWMPWAFWAVHRTIESGRRLHGVQAGLFVSLQMLSSVYYGVFLATILTLVAALLLLSESRPKAFAALRSLALGGVVAMIICGAYAVPYLAARGQVGERSPDEVAQFSARPYDYLVATPDNRIHGDVFPGRPERRQFPGIVPLLLALAGLTVRAPARWPVVYLLALVVALEMSFGWHGYSYRVLYDHVPVFGGLRAPARLGIFVIMFLAMLAAHGYRALHDLGRPIIRRGMAILVPCVLLVEYSVAPLQLVPYENAPPPLYDFVARLPPGTVVEFPLPDVLPGPDPRYIYMSTFHWKPLVNGYSGFYPPSYMWQLARLRSFPDVSSLDALKRNGVTYVVVHLPSDAAKPPPQKSQNRVATYESATPLLLDLQKYPQLVFLALLKDERGTALVCRLD